MKHSLVVLAIVVATNTLIFWFISSQGNSYGNYISSNSNSRLHEASSVGTSATTALDSDTNPTDTMRSICVMLHLGDIYEWPLIAPFLRNMRYAHDLYVTVPIDNWRSFSDCRRIDSIKAKYQRLVERSIPFSHRQIYVLPMENRALDAGGFLLTMREILKTNRNYELVLKIHTQNNSVAIHKDRSTKRYLEVLDSLLGSLEQVDKCVNLLQSDKKIGMIGLPDLLSNNTFQDVFDFASVNHLLLRTPEEGPMTYIEGAMFWARFEFMHRPFFEYKADAFDIYRNAPLGDPVGNTPATMLEMLYGDWVTSQEYRIASPDSP